MTAAPDVTVTIVFHQERGYAIPALESALDLATLARSSGISVETRAILDRPDDQTTRIVRERGNWLDDIQEVSFGDLGLTRNEGTRLARGQFLAFLDGDDLWGEEWIVAAYALASKTGARDTMVWHPERLFYFDETDFDRHSVSDQPRADARSFHMEHVSSEMTDFDWRVLTIDNIWTANAFASRQLHVAYPYHPVDRKSGFGVEDWSWNILTLANGVKHLVVPDTVHLIRQKDVGSLGQRNAFEGLLPIIPDDLVFETANLLDLVKRHSGDAT